MDYVDDSSQCEKYDEFLKVMNDFEALRIDSGRDVIERFMEMVRHYKLMLDLSPKLKSLTPKVKCDVCLKLLSVTEKVSTILKDFGVKRETLDEHHKIQVAVQLLYDQTLQQIQAS
ncbi:unnamed protein product [Trifolium pratense]|uniref:Uncharacterized protein n=1 Tax=Trifolium pratense TaxID=57577 RepID=A0ACB0IDT9_TRIPR|nr:unnamed protein product [Trifolium pratense]